ncbi:PLP-dependent aminotransferase family protein [Bdellovibrio bacteriovorus]|uniref:aminotransferase-like domain-containing protein n=1 Tax=Bdellovibrio bacteriovorus TaxID=959 RepID=UPI0035A72354
MGQKEQMLYEKVATDVESQIRRGAIQVGDKITSIRKQSEIMGVSVNTVLQAYLLLEQKGLIESRAQSGFYVSAFQITEEVRKETEIQKKPAAIQIPDLVAEMLEVASRANYLNLGAACLASELYPNAALARITRSVLRKTAEINARYEFSPGSLELRQQIAKRLTRQGNKVAAEDLVITNGAQEALYLALRTLMKNGDTVLIESPNYFGVLQAIADLGMKVIEVPADARWGVDPDDVKKILSRYKIAGAVMMPNFNNPLGSRMPDANKKEVMKVFSKFGTPVIEDDVYGDLDFSGVRPKLLRHFDEEGLVLTCSSFSKTVAPGSRCGWILPGKHLSLFRNYQISSTLGINRLQQKILAEFLASGSYERHLRKLRPLLHLQVQKISQAVLRYFPEGTRVTQPQGGFMLWVELPKEIDSVLLYSQAAAKKISIAPGVMFSANGNYRNYIRLNCGLPWRSDVEAAIKTLGALARQQVEG